MVQMEMEDEEEMAVLQVSSAEGVLLTPSGGCRLACHDLSSHLSDCDSVSAHSASK